MSFCRRTLSVACLVGLVGVAAVAPQDRISGAVLNSDIAALRDKVTGSQAFQDKLALLCKGNASCKDHASTALFCQLLSRSNPDAAENACAAEGPDKNSVAAAATTSLAAVKIKIMQSASFRREAEQLSITMGCSNVQRSDKCAAYVQEAAFCLVFADQMVRFASMAGIKQQADSCAHIDHQMPCMDEQQEAPRLVQLRSSSHLRRFLAPPEDELAKEMTHDLEMNFNKIAPFGKEDTAKELQDHAAKTQDTLVDAVENAEVAEIKRAVFRALTRLRAATIKEFDTIARLETQSIDAYNDAHHYRAENPLAHLHEDEAPVETDKLKSFH